jgi:ribosomal protein S18 acetylase RimI-like enzyme
MHLTYRKATAQDLAAIVMMLLEDELGQTREDLGDPAYAAAFNLIANDLNQYLMVVEGDGEIVGTCHLTLMPSLTLRGTTRLQVEAVRVSEKHRGQKIGEWMLQQAFDYARSHGAKLVQLTTNKKRNRAKIFYERLGFVASHEGMKLSLE